MSTLSSNRPQALFPNSPPQTPPTKEGGINRSTRPAGIYTALSAATPPPLTPDSSPHPGYSGSPKLLSPDTLPGAHSGTIGLGLGFTGSERSYAGSEKSFMIQEDEYKEKPARRSPPVSQFSSPKTRGIIANPYGEKQQPMTTTLAYLLRVPRRMRPALLIATSLFAFCLILISRSVSAAGEAQRIGMMIRQAETRASTPFGRRYIQRESGIVDINDPKQQVVIAHGTNRHAHHHPKVEQPAIQLSTQDELMALIGFVTAATGNSLPATVDPSVPIKPSVLLGFDPSGPTAHEDLEYLKDEINTQYPLVLVGRMRDPWHIEMVRLLDQYKITPQPLVIDIDQRRDHIIFIPALERLLDTTDFPQLLLQGQRLGSAHEILAMEEDKLTAAVTSTRALTMRPLTSKEKKGHGHGKNGKFKAERERLLAPAPIVED